MNYKNNTETSTQDWISLNFSKIHGPLLAHLSGVIYAQQDDSLLIRIGEPEEPAMEEPCEPYEPELLELDDDATPDWRVAVQEKYEQDMVFYEKEMEEYEAAQKHYEEVMRVWAEELERFNSLNGFPVAWNTMWTIDSDISDQSEKALLSSGFVVYKVNDEVDPDLGFRWVFGVDGGGYSFCEAHWRPLRALLSKQYAERYPSRDTIKHHNELVRFLSRDAGYRGHETESFCNRFMIQEEE